MIRVVLVDDHAVVRAGLAQLLASADDIDVVGEASDGEEAVSVVVDRGADVVLMDLSMPNVDGSEATRRLQAAAPGTQVVVLTSFSDRERILDALDAGAVGYLLKDAEPEDIIRGLHAAAAGGVPLSPRAVRSKARAWRGCVFALPQRAHRRALIGALVRYTSAGLRRSASGPVRSGWTVVIRDRVDRRRSITRRYAGWPRCI